MRLQLARGQLSISNPQTYPQLFVDITKTTTPEHRAATGEALLRRCANLPPIKRLA
jgi:hypothetical protein